MLTNARVSKPESTSYNNAAQTWSILLDRRACFLAISPIDILNTGDLRSWCPVLNKNKASFWLGVKQSFIAGVLWVLGWILPSDPDLLQAWLYIHIWNFI